VPILKKVGEDWHRGGVLIAQEHFVSSFAKQRILEFSRLFPVNRSLPKCVAFCPPGESHQIGLLLFTLFLQKKGIEVIYLGPNTTYDHLLEIIEDVHASIVCISVTDTKHLNETYQWLQPLIIRNEEIKIVLGGQAFMVHQENWEQYVLRGDFEDWEKWYEQWMTETKKPSRMEKGDRS
jgi:methanogenic corrinoid protein MtbC1